MVQQQQQQQGAHVLLCCAKCGMWCQVQSSHSCFGTDSTEYTGLLQHHFHTCEELFLEGCTLKRDVTHKGGAAEAFVSTRQLANLASSSAQA